MPTSAPPNRAPALAAPHFEGIERRWDPAVGGWVAKLLPGDYYVTIGNEWLFTLLGSCVSACVRDRALGIGGMNHFLLPEDSNGRGSWSALGGAGTRYGNVAMERLINDILKLGGRRERLEVKLVGGGRVLDAMTDIGARNIAFVREYVRAEGFHVLAEDLGSSNPRKVLFHPATGEARVKRLASARSDEVAARESRYAKTICEAPPQGDVELF
jgi:chemotaxis protein CheD